MKSESRRQSQPVKAPSEPVIKVKPENGSAPIELIAGKPLEEAEANKGTLRNKKVFVGDSTIGPQAGKGLFVAQAIGKNEWLARIPAPAKEALVEAVLLQVKIKVCPSSPRLPSVEIGAARRGQR